MVADAPIAYRAWGEPGGRGIVLVQAPEENAAQERRAFAELRVYPSREAILARFRPVPDQPVIGYIAGHVAATSIRQVDGGWTWKWDPAVFDRLGRVAPVIEIPAAAHHIMLDQPIALVAAIRTLLSDWDHSRPSAPGDA
jgi:hypothetical protein